jgi:hypothetical protein
MEAQQCVQLTGTNKPTTYTPPHPPFFSFIGLVGSGAQANAFLVLRVHYAVLKQQHAHYKTPPTISGGVRELNIV